MTWKKSNQSKPVDRPRDELTPKITAPLDDPRARRMFDRLSETGDRFEALATVCGQLLDSPDADLHHWTDPDGTERSMPHSGSMEADAKVYLTATKVLEQAMAANDTEAIRSAARWQG